MICWLLMPVAAPAQEWSRFEWSKTNLGTRKNERVAIFLPVTIKGVAGEYYMQLDTGAPRSLFYGVPYQQLLREQKLSLPLKPGGLPSKGLVALNFSGSIGPVVLDNAPCLLYQDYGTPINHQEKYPKVGTVGLDFFKEHPLIIDFPRQRFTILSKGASVPANLEREANFFAVMLKNGLLFLPVLYDDQPLGNIFYDTGSSVFPLITSRSLWQQLTGRTGDEPDNDHLTISSWGTPVVMTGARTKKLVRIGSLTAGRIMVYFAPAGSPNLSFENNPAQASGLVGNAVFYDQHMVIIDLPRNRMAFLKSR